jgi:hypothetical protein
VIDLDLVLDSLLVVQVAWFHPRTWRQASASDFSPRSLPDLASCSHRPRSPTPSSTGLTRKGATGLIK